MWLFAALIVLAMGGVAMLAAGHGAPLSTQAHDRVPSTLSSDGPLRAADLRHARFSVVLRGYRMSEVDALLHRLATEQESAGSNESAELRDLPDKDLPT